MEAELFGILKLRPGRYSPDQIVERHRRMRSEIMRDGGPERQRRLDDALIACLILQDPRKQSELLNRVNRDASINAHKVELAARRAAGKRTLSQAGAVSGRSVRRFKPISMAAVSPPAKSPAISASGDDSSRFASMVAGAVENGVLRMSARLELTERAKSMGIAAFKANLIIAEVLHDMATGWSPDGADPLAGKSESELRSNYVACAKGHQRRYGLRIVAAIAAAAAVDMLIFLWLW